MELKNMNKEELELLSYTDLTELILKENKKAMNTPSLFKTICSLLEYTDEEYANKIGEYYTSLTTDKRFVLLDSAEWDLKDNHSIPLIVEDDEELEEDMEDDEEEISEDDETDVDVDADIVDDLDLDEDEMDDLAIVDDEELEEED